MAIDDKIRDEKLQYRSEYEYKCEYLTGKVILPSDQRRVIKQGKFTYSALGTAFKDKWKQLKSMNKASWSFWSFKTRKNQKALKPIDGIFPKEIINNKIDNE